MFLSGIYWLLVTDKTRSALRNANHCQGQLQTPQSLSVASRLAGNNKRGITAYVSFRKSSLLVRWITNA
jgi:hypothetical protein